MNSRIRHCRTTRVLKLFVVFALILPASPLAATEPEVSVSRLAAWTKHLAMEKESPFGKLVWQRLGPKFAGGRIESIDAPLNDSGTIYVGVGSGGVWKTVNGGLSWNPVFEHESTFAVGDLTVAPSDPNTIWVGTGEAHLSGTSYAGTGVFKSIDAGASWTNQGLHDSAHIGKIVIDPKDKDTVYVAAMGRNGGGGERGVFKTTDGGRTFRQVLSAGQRVAIVDLVIDPRNDDCLFAAAWDRGQRKKSGVFRSVDRGEHWKRLAGGLLEENVGRVAVDVARSNPGVVYALMVDHSPSGQGRQGVGGILFRSDDHGDHWKRTHEKYLPTYVGWDFCDVRVAPDDADRVYICGFRLLVSGDGGASFERGGEDVFRLHAHRGKGMHLDMHDIWIDPQRPERILLGNDGGLYVSWDRGGSWLHLNNLPIAEFYQISLDSQDPFQIWGGTQDNASFVGPTTARFEAGREDGWQQVFLDPWAGGDGFSTFPDPHDSQIVYYAQQQGDLKRARRGVLRPEKRIRPRPERGQPELRFSWDTPFFASRHFADTRLYCAAQIVFQSDDRGDSWQPISPDLESGAITALGESPLDARRLVAGGRAGQVHFTADGGKNWLPAPSGLPPVEVRDVVASAHDTDIVYVALSGKRKHNINAYVFRSDGFGKTWQSVAGNLPSEPVNAISEDPEMGGVLYAGTDLGVYVSINGGRQWSSLCKTLPTAPVVDLAVHGPTGTLVAATHGLSLFSLDTTAIREAAKAQRKSERKNKSSGASQKSR